MVLDIKKKRRYGLYFLTLILSYPKSIKYEKIEGVPLEITKLMLFVVKPEAIVNSLYAIKVELTQSF